MAKTIVNPPTVPAPTGYSYAIKKKGTPVFISGQVALDAQGKLVGENDAAAQTDPEFALYDGTYAATTKRCSLWSIDTKTRTFTPLFDVPGVGDTCYPEMIRQPHGQFLVYNYTSPLDGSDPPWGTALTVGDTLIYRMTLQFG